MPEDVHYRSPIMARPEAMLAWIDRSRLWFFALAIVLGLVTYALERSGQVGIPTHIMGALVPVFLALILTVRARQTARLAIGLIAAVPLCVSALINIFVGQGSHPELTALIALNVVLVIVVGFPLGLYTERGISVRDDGSPL
jgi:hypothetical protein